MFNLIVSGGLRDKPRGAILAKRVFEYTDDAVYRRFQPKGGLDIPALMMLGEFHREAQHGGRMMYPSRKGERCTAPGS